jgi:hypothetical protein
MFIKYIEAYDNVAEVDTSLFKITFTEVVSETDLTPKGQELFGVIATNNDPLTKASGGYIGSTELLTIVGIYKVSLTYVGTEIQSARPGLILVQVVPGAVDVANVKFFGTGRGPSAIAGVSLRLNATIQDKFSNQITSSTASFLRLEINTNPATTLRTFNFLPVDGIYTVAFALNTAGSYDLTVKILPLGLSTYAVAGSGSFAVRVVPGALDIKSTYVEPLSSAIAGNTITTIFQLRDAYRNSKVVAPADFSIDGTRVTGPAMLTYSGSGTDFKLTQLPNGRYSLTYVLYTAGTYVFSLTLSTPETADLSPSAYLWSRPVTSTRTCAPPATTPSPSPPL